MNEKYYETSSLFILTIADANSSGWQMSLHLQPQKYGRSLKYSKGVAQFTMVSMPSPNVLVTDLH